jgi:hypothetical protein
MPGRGTTVLTMIVGMVWSAEVFSGAGVVVMGAIGVTTLHPWGSRDLELPQHLRWHRPSWRNPRGRCVKMNMCPARQGKNSGDRSDRR